MREIPEADWKVFRAFRELALERFCRRALEDLQPLLRDPSRTCHQRYLEARRLFEARDNEFSYAFDDPRRSRMMVQLAAICGHGLLEPHELARFTARTRETIESLAKGLRD